MTREEVALWLIGPEAKAETIAVLFQLRDIEEIPFGDIADKVLRQLAYMVENRATIGGSAR